MSTHFRKEHISNIETHKEYMHIAIKGLKNKKLEVKNKNNISHMNKKDY